MNSHSTNLPPGFQFVDDPASWTDPAARIVQIPRGVRGKRTLLTEYVRQLSLPEYFGWNWDALDECLRDLHWLPKVQRVAIVHEALPLARSSNGRRIYVQLLRGAVTAWKTGDEHELTVVFPTRARDEIINLLAASSS
jgi:hypothetical protein